MTDYKHAAQRLSENPAVQRALDDMAQDIKDAWATTPANCPDRMVELRRDLDALDKLRAKLDGYCFDLIAVD